jgi:hypothetical protein
MMFGFTPKTRGPMLTVPELLLIIVLVAAIIAVILGGTHLWRQHAHHRDS